MESRMLSLEFISTLRTAIRTCLHPEVKREILCAPGSDYDVNKSSNQYDRKHQWNEIVEKKARVLLRDLGLPEMLQNKVMSIVRAVGLRMLIWAEYHEGSLGFTREYSIRFLHYSLFTQEGVIDNEKAARELMEDMSFSTKQKYKIACMYCFEDKICYLYRKMVEDKTKAFCFVREYKWILQPDIVKFWTHQQMGVVDINNRNKAPYRYRLDAAIKSGIRAAVEHSWSQIVLKMQPYTLEYAAEEVLRSKAFIQDDWIVFRDERYDDSKETWVPNDYFVDILCFLLPHMTKEGKIRLLNRDITRFDNHSRNSKFLELLLTWPYQDYFMETANIMWDVLPRRTFVALLLKIYDNIEPRKEKNLMYGEERSYDYRSLFKEFWCQSPERFKRYVFTNEKETNTADGVVKTKTGVDLVIKLGTLKKFTKEDEAVLQVILDSANYGERLHIIASEEFRNTCIRLIKEGKWGILDHLMTNCLPSKEEADKFRTNLSFTDEAKLVFINFAKYDRWNAANSFIKWVSLPEPQIWTLKYEIFFSHGKEECLKLLSSNRIETAEKLIRWCFPFGEDAVLLKSRLISELNAKRHCLDLTDEYTYVFELLHNSTVSKRARNERINNLKKSVDYKFGFKICEELIANYSLNFIYSENGHDVIQTQIHFTGGQWVKANSFLTCYFTSLRNINAFKKKLLETAGTKILIKLIKSNQLGQAENFFAWLGLQPDETKMLKKRTLFEEREAWVMFSELVFCSGRNELFGCFRKSDVDRLLRWYLEDKKSVLEFRDAFMLEHETFEEAGLNYFYWVIKGYLSDIDKKQAASLGASSNVIVLLERMVSGPLSNQCGLKRKSDTTRPEKKLSNLKIKTKDNKGTSCSKYRLKSQRLINKSKKK